MKCLCKDTIYMWPQKRRKILDKLKACVRYFLTNFSLSENDSPSKTMKDVSHFI